MIDLNRMGRNEINDYVVYKIVCLSNPNLVYVGSTANFYARRIGHKTKCNNPNCKAYNHKNYVVIRENGGWENWNMVIVDELKQITLIKSRMIEEEWRVKLNANLNSQKCFRTDEEKKEYYNKNKDIFVEYYNKNKDILCDQQKEHYHNNKDMILAQRKEYYQDNKDIMNEKTNEYYHNNKDILSEKKKEYYQNNKDTLLVRQKEKVICVCGCITVKKYLSKHMKTQKHLKLLAQQTTEVN